MTALYAIATLAGTLLLFAWIVSAALSAGAGEAARFDGAARFGLRGRIAIAGLLGFGLAGMSATFAGWAIAPAAVAAIAGAAALAGYAVWDGRQ